MPARETQLTPRKQPRQRRSQETLAAILDGAARVFERYGYARGTTNRIAKAAGVSIGSLYEYFPNKDAILVALAERQVDRMLAEVQAVLARAGAEPGPLDATLRRFVQAMLEVHERDPILHQLVFSEAPHPAALHTCVLRMEEALAHAVEAILRASPELSLDDPDTSAHLVMQTVEALTHRFVHHGIHDLERESFADEVVALLRGYLCAEQWRASSASG